MFNYEKALNILLLLSKEHDDPASDQVLLNELNELCKNMKSHEVQRLEYNLASYHKALKIARSLVMPEQDIDEMVAAVAEDFALRDGK